jgi:peroxiredoxin Q/BCP
MNSRAATTTSVQMGDHAPDFTLLNQDGVPVHFADLLGAGPIVLYFYPKDFTAGCSTQACHFRDRYDVFKNAGAIVVGVSDDSVASHKSFATRHQLPFTLLSDPGGSVRKLYGVSRPLGVLPGRTTYVIDRQGMVRLVFTNHLDMGSHIRQAMKVLESL